MFHKTMPYVQSKHVPVQPAIDYERHPAFRDRARWRNDVHRVVFGNITRAGRLFDVILIFVILASVGVVMLESVDRFASRSRGVLWALEWVFSATFTIEYAFRLASAQRAGRYARSFFGIVDLMAILPTYIGLVVPGGQALAVIRVLRVLRVFRVLKLAQFVGGEVLLLRAFRSSMHKIAVFLIAVVVVVAVVGAAMYVIEGPGSGFTSIPVGVYWAIVTVTTVGYGDVTPVTVAGRALASLLMILGYGVIAVPTGIVTAQIAGDRRILARATRRGGLRDSGGSLRGAGGVRPAVREPPGFGDRDERACPKCPAVGHHPDAQYCQYCGEALGQ